MFRMKKMIAIATLAVMVGMGTQTAFGGIMLSDRSETVSPEQVEAPDMSDALMQYLTDGWLFLAGDITGGW